MSSAPFGTSPADPQVLGSPERETGMDAIRGRHHKRTEDTGAGCRANAAADLVRAGAPDGVYMRERFERSAAVWAERATLLERLERNFERRMRAA
jgi:hypothetical protein